MNAQEDWAPMEEELKCQTKTPRKRAMTAKEKTDGDKKQHTPSSHLTYPRNASPPNTTLNTTSPRDRNGHAGRMGSPLAQPTARMEVADVRVANVVAN